MGCLTVCGGGAIKAGSVISSGGAVAQLGARLDGIEEVRGSNPLGSTNSSVKFFVYILQSQSTGRYYVGQSKKLDERVAYHNAFFLCKNRVS
jgi:hypothetical protein